MIARVDWGIISRCINELYIRIFIHSWKLVYITCEMQQLLGQGDDDGGFRNVRLNFQLLLHKMDLERHKLRMHVHGRALGGHNNHVIGRMLHPLFHSLVHMGCSIRCTQKVLPHFQCL